MIEVKPSSLEELAEIEEEWKSHLVDIFGRKNFEDGYSMFNREYNSNAIYYDDFTFRKAPVPVTGDPVLDGIMGVEPHPDPNVDGCWHDPLTGYVPGSYIAALVDAAKSLGYKGQFLAFVVQAAAQSSVNSPGACE